AAMNAVRRLASRTFEHMHQLSLRFHLERKTGGLTRVLERGRNAIETIVGMVIMQLVPTIIELGRMLVVLLYQFDWRYVVVILSVVALYIAFTYQGTEGRSNICRRLNARDSRGRATGGARTSGGNVSGRRRAKPPATAAGWRATRGRASRPMSRPPCPTPAKPRSSRSALPPSW